MKSDDRIYLVGRHQDNPWKMRGLFDRLEDAVKAAKEMDGFILNLPRNAGFDEAQEWPAWYPAREVIPAGFLR